MSMPDADLVIDVPVEAPPPEPQTDTQVQVTTPAAPEPVTTDEPIAALKQQLDALQKSEADAKTQAAADKAEARRQADVANRAQQALQQANVAIVESNTTAIENAIAAAQTEAESAAREQAAASAAGDFANAAALGRKAARAEARIERLEEGKADLEARRTQVAQQREQPQPQAPANDFEARIANAAPRAREWLRAHPQYVTDDRLVYRAAAADSLALSEGIQRETDAYFDFCERQLGLKSDPAPAQPSTRQQSTSRTATMPAAPVSRDTTPTGGSTSPTQVKLTPGEQRAATDGTVVWNFTDPKIGAVKNAPVGLKEYARRKLAMTNDGLYDRNRTDN